MRCFGAVALTLAFGCVQPAIIERGGTSRVGWCDVTSSSCAVGGSGTAADLVSAGVVAGLVGVLGFATWRRLTND